MRITQIDSTSPHFSSVKSLWRKNSDVLGFLPEGAFAEAKHLFVALDCNGQFVGYLLWRASRGRAAITHLCVDEGQRGRGYAAALVKELVKNTKHLRWIDLRCRRDFDAHSFWPKHGFAAIGEVDGRSAQGTKLTCWRFDQGHVDLFAFQSESNRLDAVIDTSVFIDLLEKRNEESLALLADWLEPSLRLSITLEMFNDLDRNPIESERCKRKADARQFTIIPSQPDEYAKAETILKPLFPNTESAQDASDFRHVVRTLAAGLTVFVTRDQELLNRADDVYALCGLSILTPAEVIARVDELSREREYQRLQIAGTNKVFKKRVTTCSQAILARFNEPNGRKAPFREFLAPFFARPKDFECWTVENDVSEPIAFFVIQRNDEELRLPLFRIHGARIAGTLARSLLTELSYQAASSGAARLVICDQKLSVDLHAACDELGFLKSAEGRLKLVVYGVHGARELAAHCIGVDQSIGELRAVLEAGPITDATVAAEVEHVLWPAKLSDPPIPTFLVPIKPEFAQHLFDENLAKQTLFGADIELALNPESVYYRSARTSGLRQPCRIMWYVSGVGRFAGTMRIRAVSQVVEIAIGKPKPVFRRFRRLGVFEWDDVFKVAKRDLDGEVMAIRFRDTELLPNPLTRAMYEPILKKHGVTTNIQSPRQIPNAAFCELYAVGCKSTRTAPVHTS